MNIGEFTPISFDPNTVNYNDINNRDKIIIEEFLQKYSVDVSYERLMKEFVDTYPFAENTEKVKRFRLMGIKITYDEAIEENEDGWKRVVQDPSSKKTSREQILVLNRKKIESMSIEEMEEVSYDCFRFSKAFEQLKSFSKITDSEFEIQNSVGVSHMSALLMKTDNLKK